MHYNRASWSRTDLTTFPLASRRLACPDYAPGAHYRADGEARLRPHVQRGRDTAAQCDLLAELLGDLYPHASWDA